MGMKSSVLLSVFLPLLFKYKGTSELIQLPKLRLVFLQSNNHCLIENEVFDVVFSMVAATSYSRRFTEGLLQKDDISLLNKLIAGCSLQEENRMENIVKFLHYLAPQIEAFKGYTVYIGPRAGSACNFINDWVAQSKLVQTAYGSLQQIAYACVTDSLVRYYGKTAPKRKNTALLDNLASVTIGIPNEELYKPLNSFLRQRGWKNIVILYERSQLVLQNAGLAETIAYLLSNADELKMKVILMASLQWDSDPVRMLSGFSVKCHDALETLEPVVNLHTKPSIR